MSKKCSICEIEKELSEYYKQNKKRKDGTEYVYYPPYCKECTKNKTIEQRDPQRVYELNKIYRNTRPTTIEARKRSNKKRTKEGKVKEWQRNNPDKMKGYNLQRNTNKKHEITNKEWENCKNYFNYRCAYCGLKLEDHYVQYRGKTILGDFHKEHVDHNGANDLSNCIPACRSCNGQKWTYELTDWYNDSNTNFTYERLNKIYKWLEHDYKQYINKNKIIKKGEIYNVK